MIINKDKVKKKQKRKKENKASEDERILKQQVLLLKNDMMKSKSITMLSSLSFKKKPNKVDIKNVSAHKNNITFPAQLISNNNNNMKVREIRKRKKKKKVNNFIIERYTS